MTPEQLTILKAAIMAETDAAFVAARTAGATGTMAAFYNAQAAPAFYVWRRDYSPQQIAEAIDNGVTQLDALTASKRDSLLWWAERSHDMTRSQSQAAVNDLCGSQNTLKAAVLDGGKKTITRGQKLFASGTGSLAVPGTTTLDGDISGDDVATALGS